MNQNIQGFHSRLKELRKERGLNQGNLASGVKMCRTQICEMERNRVTPNMWHLLEFARFFSVSLDYLTGLSDKREVA